MNQENVYAEIVVAETVETLPRSTGGSSFPSTVALPADSDAELISEARLYLVAMSTLFSDGG